MRNPKSSSPAKTVSFLLLKYSFHLPDFLLHLAAYLLVRSLIYESRIGRSTSTLFFHLPFYFVERSFCLVPAALLHDCLLWPIYVANKINKQSVSFRPNAQLIERHRNFSNATAISRTPPQHLCRGAACCALSPMFGTTARACVISAHATLLVPQVR